MKKQSNNKFAVYSLQFAICISLLTANCLLPIISFSQNIAINTSGNLGNASAGLDIDFTNKGLLIPRVALQSATDGTTISNPATSLLVYSLGGVVPDGYYYNSGTPAAPNWVQLITSQSSNGSCPTDITNELDASDNPCVGTACGTTRALRNCIDACDALVYNGYNDWQAPTLREILILRDVAPGNTSTRGIWTVTPVISLGINYHVVRVDYGAVSSVTFSGATSSLYCRCVR